MLADTGRFFVALKDVDVVHLNPSIGSKALVRDGLLLLAARLRRKKTIVFAHGWDPRFEPRLRRFVTLFRFVFGRADAFVVLGSPFAAKLRGLGFNGRIVVQRAPIDDALLADAAAAPPRGSPDFTLLFLARVEKEKGIYEVLETFKLLRSRYPRIRLLVAGDGSERKRAASADLEGVTFLGNVDGSQKFRAFRSADAYLLPSHHEGLPISVLEAMAYGLPVVASAVGALPDFFEDGAMGFLVAGPDPPALAAAISRLIEEPELISRIRRFNRQYAPAFFSGRRIAGQLEELYRDVAAQSD